MSISINVVYEDNNRDTFNFRLPPARKTFLQRHRATTAILCDLKRNIATKRSIPVLEQSLRFNQVTTFDDILTNTVCPTVFCSKRPRNAVNSVIVESWNKEEHKLSVDKNDTVIDLKFLLADSIGSKPEYVHLVKNFKERVFTNASSLLQSGLLQSNNIRIHYWLEFPQFDSGKPNEFVIRSQPKLLTVPEYMSNVGKCFRYFTKKYPHNPHLGTRKWTMSGTRGEFEWMTFSELDENVSYLATGFVRKLGLSMGTRMGLCSMNRAEWVMSDYAGHTQGFVSIPLYDTLAKNAIEYIVKHANVSLIVCNKETLPEVVKAKQVCPSMKYIVLMDLQSADQEWMKTNSREKAGYTHTISELIEFGKKQSNNLEPDRFAKPDDFCTICYTSGTTGDPKGVLLKHSALLTTVEALSGKLDEYIDEDGVHISYLPLAHMYEKLVELIILVKGARIGYWSGDVLTLLDDIVAAKPTIFMGVPRVYQKFQDKIMMGVNEANFVRRFLFNKAYESKIASIKNQSEANAIWEKLVFSKIKDKFGGRIKACVSGSAPLSATLANFLKACFCDVVVEGYGLTETSAAGTGTDSDDSLYGQVGAVVSAVEMKLVDVEDMNYTINDEPLPRGEIWFRGPALFSGYYRMKEKTEEVLNKDGWFATGDIGQWRLDGKLQIVDRKKNIFKLAQGEYIRPDFIENVYKLSPLVGNIFVHGDSDQTYLVAVVYPDMEVFASTWCKQNGLGHISGNPAEIIKHDKVKQAIRMDMERIAKQEALTGFEKVKRIHLVDADFTIDNGLLTSTMKLKRNVARQRFQSAIKQMYAQAAPSKL
eukprot:CAMPEP_0197030740 /NCGR_PEP_ID=MMETSP1384-20130603/9906_1 /TAXON_ID=29189 /ORGANISM="Ammonia sp." /LENGTH=817 /DNA_ID=CAMNT_0042460143 /DNA_START=22 /DNA_END=2475 /DNA_ORIENTATION=+